MLEIKVIPGSGKQILELDRTGRLKCFLKSPAEKGKANKELIKLLSKKLSMPQKDITIIRGAAARNKVVKVDSNDSEDVIWEKLRLQNQLTIF